MQHTNTNKVFERIVLSKQLEKKIITFLKAINQKQNKFFIWSYQSTLDMIAKNVFEVEPHFYEQSIKDWGNAEFYENHSRQIDSKSLFIIDVYKFQSEISSVSITLGFDFRTSNKVLMELTGTVSKERVKDKEKLDLFLEKIGFKRDQKVSWAEAQDVIKKILKEQKS